MRKYVRNFGFVEELKEGEPLRNVVLGLGEDARVMRTGVNVYARHDARTIPLPKSGVVKCSVAVDGTSKYATLDSPVVHLSTGMLYRCTNGLYTITSTYQHPEASWVRIVLSGDNLEMPGKKIRKTIFLNEDEMFSLESSIDPSTLPIESAGPYWDNDEGREVYFAVNPVGFGRFRNDVGENLIAKRGDFTSGRFDFTGEFTTERHPSDVFTAKRFTKPSRL